MFEKIVLVVLVSDRIHQLTILMNSLSEAIIYTPLGSFSFTIIYTIYFLLRVSFLLMTLMEQRILPITA